MNRCFDFFMIPVLLLAWKSAVSAEPVCRDVDSEVCQKLQRMRRDLCANSCLSKLCPQTCDICPLYCFECRSIPDPSKCNTTTTCQRRSDKCIISKGFDASFQDAYNVGCATDSLCLERFASPVSIGRRSKRSLDGACCDLSLCNNRPPEIIADVNQELSNSHGTAHNSFASGNAAYTCQDIDNFVCSRLNALVHDMCQSECIMADLCPRSCFRCVECYTCLNITDPTQCQDTLLCEKDQKCFIFAPTPSTYSQGCIDSSVCNFKNNSHCCGYDLCNDRMHEITNSATTITQATTTTTPPKTTAVITSGNRTNTLSTTTVTTTTTTLDPITSCTQSPPTNLITGCPAEFTLYHGKCYTIGNELGSFHQAKDYCSRHCADLAHFQDSQQAMDVIHYVRRHQHNLHEKQNVHAYYLDGKFVSGHWTWASSGQIITTPAIVSVHGHQNSCLVVTTTNVMFTTTSTFSAAPCLDGHGIICYRRQNAS